jgi:hypothetical protein
VGKSEIDQRSSASYLALALHVEAVDVVALLAKDGRLDVLLDARQAEKMASIALRMRKKLKAALYKQEE